MDDDALITRFLGRQFIGRRRYLRDAELQALGLVDNRSSLSWLLGLIAWLRRVQQRRRSINE